jgi:hypothetical protein
MASASRQIVVYIIPTVNLILSDQSLAALKESGSITDIIGFSCDRRHCRTRAGRGSKGGFGIWYPNDARKEKGA